MTTTRIAPRSTARNYDKRGLRHSRPGSLQLMTLAGVLPVLLIGATLWLWSRGAATPGDITAAGAISIRIAQMTGWVSFTLMAMYSNVGEVEDGMNTLTPPHQLSDMAGADPLPEGAEVRFEDVTFTYGRNEGGLRDVTLTLHEGEKLGVVGQRCGSTWSRFCCGSMTPRRGASGSRQGHSRHHAGEPAPPHRDGRRKPRCLTARRAKTSCMAARPRTDEAGMRPRRGISSSRSGSQGADRLRRPSGRAGREAVGRPAPADRAGRAIEDAPILVGRGDLGARSPGGRDPGSARPGDGRQTVLAIAHRRWRTWTGSSCWRTGASSRKAPIPTCWAWRPCPLPAAVAGGQKHDEAAE